MEIILDFINKTSILPNVKLESFSKKSNNECRSWDCYDDCLRECGNCEDGDYDWHPNCDDCFHDCEDWDDCFHDCEDWNDCL